MSAEQLAGIRVVSGAGCSIRIRSVQGQLGCVRKVASICNLADQLGDPLTNCRGAGIVPHSSAHRLHRRPLSTWSSARPPFW